MKIGCVFARRKNWPMWEWVSQAVANAGHELVTVNHVDQLMAADSVCDFLLFEHRDCGIGWRHVRDNAASRTCPWIQWNWDLILWDDRHIREQFYIEKYGESMRLFDLCLVKERGRISEFAEAGITAEYMDQGVYSDCFVVAHQESPEWDVVVFGQSEPHYKERLSAVRELVSSGFKVVWATNGSVPKGCDILPWHHPNDLASLMSRGKCVLDIDLRTDVDGYWSDRRWIINGSGGIGIRRGWFGGGSVSDAASAICDMSFHERRELGEKIRRQALSSETYEHRIESIIGIVPRIASKQEVLPSV